MTYRSSLLYNMADRNPQSIDHLTEDILTLLAENGGRLSKSDLMSGLQGEGLSCVLVGSKITRRWHFSDYSAYDLADAAEELGFTVTREVRKSGCCGPWHISL